LARVCCTAFNVDPRRVACARELGIDGGRLNVNGGAIALGHPLGCSGARLLTTLAWELRRRGGRYGIASLCVGVGQGLATVIERVRTTRPAGLG
jgi:acetyl-CoA acetyltransferase